MIWEDVEIKAATGLITVQRTIDPDVIYLRPELLSYEKEQIERWLTETLQWVILHTIADGREYIVKCDPRVYEYEHPKPPHERSLSKRVWIWLLNWRDCEVGEYAHEGGLPLNSNPLAMANKGIIKHFWLDEIGWNRID